MRISFIILALSIATIGVVASAPSATSNEGSSTMPLPKTKYGEGVIGTRLPIEELRWANTQDGAAPTLDDRVTLVRWWTDSCPYCAGSLPAIGALERAYSGQGFQTIAVYHPKPPRTVTNAAVLAAAHQIGYAGIVAVDEDWGVLRKAYLDTGDRGATSVSFLLDGAGTIRYVHPGPELRPGKGRKESDVQAQYDEMRQAIAALLAERAEASAE